MTTKKAHARKPLLKRYKLVLDSTQTILDLMIDGYYVIKPSLQWHIQPYRKHWAKYGRKTRPRGMHRRDLNKSIQKSRSQEAE